MIEVITEYLRDQLQHSLSFADLVGSIAIPFKKKVGNIEKTVPVWKQIAHQEGCETEDYVYLIPDAKRKSVVFFELESNTFTEFNRRYAEGKAAVNVICWLNYHATSKFLYTTVPYEAELMREILKLPASLTHTYPVSLEQCTVNGIRIEAAGTIPRNNVWSKYTLDEVRTQYGMYPYDYFGQKYIISYRFNPDCYLQIIQTEADCINHKINPQKCESFVAEEEEEIPE